MRGAVCCQDSFFLCPTPMTSNIIRRIRKIWLLALVHHWSDVDVQALEFRRLYDNHSGMMLVSRVECYTSQSRADYLQTRNNVTVTGCHSFRTVVNFTLVCFWTRLFALWFGNKPVNLDLLPIPYPDRGLTPKLRPTSRPHSSKSNWKPQYESTRTRNCLTPDFDRLRLRVRVGVWSRSVSEF